MAMRHHDMPPAPVGRRRLVRGPRPLPGGVGQAGPGAGGATSHMAGPPTPGPGPAPQRFVLGEDEATTWTRLGEVEGCQCEGEALGLGHGEATRQTPRLAPG